jgi:hypothetical protein
MIEPFQIKMLKSTREWASLSSSNDTAVHFDDRNDTAEGAGYKSLACAIDLNQ